MLARILTLLFILIQCVSFAQNKFTISGYVTDAETGEEVKPINGTYEVRISDERARLFYFALEGG